MRRKTQLAQTEGFDGIGLGACPWAIEVSTYQIYSAKGI